MAKCCTMSLYRLPEEEFDYEATVVLEDELGLLGMCPPPRFYGGGDRIHRKGEIDSTLFSVVVRIDYGGGYTAAWSFMCDISYIQLW